MKAVVFDFDQLPETARKKFGGTNFSINDLSPAQKELAQSAEIHAIIKNGRVTILTPITNFIGTIKAIRQARIEAGI